MPPDEVPENKEKPVNKTVLVDSVAAVGAQMREQAVSGHGGGNAVEVIRPRETVIALEMIAGGATRKEIQDRTGIGILCQIALRARHAGPLAERRKQLALDGFELAEGMRLLLKEKIEHLAANPAELHKTSLKDMAIGYGIFQDKGFAALGETQSRVLVEHRHGVSIEDAQAAIAAAKTKLAAVATEVVVKEVGDGDAEQS